MMNIYEESTLNFWICVIPFTYRVHTLFAQLFIQFSRLKDICVCIHVYVSNCIFWSIFVIYLIVGSFPIL